MQNKFKLVVVMLVISTLVFPLASYADNTPMFKIGTKLFVTPAGEPSPYINKDNRTMGSLRLVANALGVTNDNINWDKASETATLTKGERVVSVTLGKKEIIVNGQVVTMDTVAEMKQGRVFIPARFIAEALGMYVGYDTIGKQVVLSDKPLSELPKHNIEDMLDMEVTAQFPLKFNAEGILLTVHELTIIDVYLEEGKALNEKYDFAGVRTLNKNPANEAYLVKTEVEVKNNGAKLLEHGYNNITPFFKISVGGGYSFGANYSAKQEYNYYNNTELLKAFSLEPGESVSGTMYFFITDLDGLDYLKFMLGRVNEDIQKIAEKR